MRPARTGDANSVTQHHKGSLFSAPIPLLSLVLTLVLGGVVAASPLLDAQSRTASEYEIKAAFLYNFAKFVEWPPGTFADPDVPFTFCILGPDPFGHALEDAILGKTIEGRRIALVRAKRVQDLPACHIVFVSSTENSRLLEILAGMYGRSVLVVGETENFASSGGTIQFILEGNRVRFAVNPNAADRARLKISSKLLSLAHIVHDSDRAEARRN
jgi:hypothetical protein